MQIFDRILKYVSEVGRWIASENFGKNHWFSLKSIGKIIYLNKKVWNKSARKKLLDIEWILRIKWAEVAPSGNILDITKVTGGGGGEGGAGGVSFYISILITVFVYFFIESLMLSYYWKPLPSKLLNII